MNFPLKNPKAFMGYVCLKTDGRVLVKICSWCHDADQANAEAKSADQDITHGMCPDCFAKEMGAEVEEPLCYSPAEKTP